MKAGLVRLFLYLSFPKFVYGLRYTSNCEEKNRLTSKKTLDLNKLFSFIDSQQALPELPTHHYYFDFDFTDSYNFWPNFDKPTKITNTHGFKNKINNFYFTVESEIVKNSETKYLLGLSLL